MEKEIYFTNNDFDFKQISLSHPVSVQGGVYFTKIKMNNDNLYVQLPTCVSKQGLNETSKKAYVDLIFTNDDYELIEWFENLEKSLIDLLDNKKNIWFQNEMDRDDIENIFNPICRPYKGGKFYLIRINIPKNKNANSQYNCDIYDENDNINIPIKDLNNTHNIIPILEIQGIKFSSKNFQLELFGKQMMIMNNKPLFKSCIIKKDNIKKESECLGKYIKQNENELPEYKNYTQNEDINVSEESNNNLEVNNNNLENDDDDNLEVSNETLEKSNNNLEVSNETLKDDDETLEKSNNNLELSNETLEVSNETLKDDNETLKDDDETLTDDDETLEVSNNNLNSFGLEDISNKININNNNLKHIKLKEPNEVYYNLYMLAKENAKKHKKNAISAYLEARQIKNTYFLNDLDNSDDSSDEYDSDTEKLKTKLMK